jgi:hypothetical protein
MVKMQISVPMVHPVVVPMESVWYLQGDFLVSICTLMLAILTSWLAWETRKMRKGNDEIMGKMVEYAAASAHAASTGALATNALVVVGQRPWISVRSIYLIHEITPLHGAVSLSTTFVNSGATPAKNLLANHYFLVASDEFPETPAYPSAAASKPIPVTLAAKEARSVVVQLPISEVDIGRITHNDGHLYVYGVATYSDGFGNEHRTTWCSKYDGGVGKQTRFSLTGKHESIE